MPNPNAQKNPSFFLPEALQGLADMGRGAVRGALAEGLGGMGDFTQSMKDVRMAGFMPAMLARGLQGPTSEELNQDLRGITPNPLTQPDRAHTARMGQTLGTIPASVAGGVGTNAAAQKAMAKLSSMQKVESVMPKAPKPVAEILKGPDPDLMRVYSGQRIPIEGKFDIMRADPHASMGRAFYTAELPRYANKFTGNQPGANVTPVDVDRNRMLMFDKMYDTPQGKMEGLDYYDMLRRQAMVKPGIGKDMIRQEILDAGFAGTQMPNATGKAYAIYDPSVAQDMSGRGFAKGGMVTGRHNDDGSGAIGADSWRADNASDGVPRMAFGGFFNAPKAPPAGSITIDPIESAPYQGINPMASGLGQQVFQNKLKQDSSDFMALQRQNRFANQGADRLARQNQLAAAKTARLNALTPKLSTYVAPKAQGGLAHMAGGGLAKKAAEKAFRALPGQSFQGKTGLNMEMPRDVEKRILEMTETGLILPSEALGKHEGKTLMITQADRTKVGEGFLGGPGFSGIQLTEPRYAGATWGVKTPGVGQTIIGSNRRVPEGQAIWTTMLGTPTQHKSNQMVFDRLYKEFMGGVKQEKLTPELKDTLNAKLASVVDKEGKNLFPADVDITNPRKFRKLVDTFDKRAAAADVMGGIGVGGKKGQIFDYDRIIQRTTDPALLEVPTGSLGNRLFQLSGEMMDRPDLHPAFPTILKGEDLGVSFMPAPRELLMEDYINKVLTEKGRQPGYMDWTRGYAPSQFLSEELLTKLQKAGYKKGGKVRKMSDGGGMFQMTDYASGPINREVNWAKLQEDRVRTPEEFERILQNLNLNNIPSLYPEIPRSQEELENRDYQLYAYYGLPNLASNPPNEYLTGPIDDIRNALNVGSMPNQEQISMIEANQLYDPVGSASASEMPQFNEEPMLYESNNFTSELSGDLNPAFERELRHWEQTGNWGGGGGGFGKGTGLDFEMLLYKKGGKVKKMQAGGIAKAVKSGLQALDKPAKQTITSAIDPTTDIASRLTQPDRVNLLPMPSRWFLDPKNNPGVQKLVEKVLEVNNMKRSDFYSGAFVNPRTGEVMDKKVMQDVGVLINPATGRPMMSAEREVDITIGDRNKGSKTKSNLVRKQLYETEGDPILKDLDFLVAIEQSGMGHKYGLATEYATPAEMFNTMTGDNPTLRPMSRGDVFGIGDIVGRMSMKSSKMPHDVYESLLIAPKGSDVQGVKLSKKHGGRVKGRK